jgi:hypothetical protein
MIKVQILIHCEACDGEAYLPIGETLSYSGEVYTRYEPCPQCQGSGKQIKWVSLSEFIDLLDKEAVKDPMQSDYLELARHKPISQYADSCEAAGI